MTEINLNYNFLTGDIPASIANLKYLETLNIESNNIKSIPKELGDYKHKRLSLEATLIYQLTLKFLIIILIILHILTFLDVVTLQEMYLNLA